MFGGCLALCDLIECVHATASASTAAADIRLFDFKENVLSNAKEARMKNEALMEKEKKVFKDSKVHQAIHEYSK